MEDSKTKGTNAINEAKRLVDEMETELMMKKEFSEFLEEENEELNRALEGVKTKAKELELEKEDLIKEANEARASFNALQLAVGVLIFLYGLMYGRYTC